MNAVYLHFEAHEELVRAGIPANGRRGDNLAQSPVTHSVIINARHHLVLMPLNEDTIYIKLRKK